LGIASGQFPSLGNGSQRYGIAPAGNQGQGVQVGGFDCTVGSVAVAAVVVDVGCGCGGGGGEVVRARAPLLRSEIQKKCPNSISLDFD